MEYVAVNGVKGSSTDHPGFGGAGFKIRAPYSELAAKTREARRELLKLLQMHANDAQTPLLFTVSPPEKITSMEDVHTLYVLTEEKAFQAESIPGDLVRLEVPAQRCIHFHYRGPMKDSAAFYFELFDRIREGEIDYDGSGYRIEAYGNEHDWDDLETESNELDIYFPLKRSRP
jgi:predicted transcriptional regulator YdeE